jgi:hypothetical protein
MIRLGIRFTVRLRWSRRSDPVRADVPAGQHLNCLGASLQRKSVSCESDRVNWVKPAIILHFCPTRAYNEAVSIVETITQKVQSLPVDRQREVLHFVETLGREPRVGDARHDPEGMLAGQVSGLTIDDISKARKKMWASFPREFPE